MPGLRIVLEAQNFMYGRNFDISDESDWDHFKFGDGNFLAPNENGILRPTNATLSNKEDWALMVINLTSFYNLDMMLEDFAWLHKEYSIREIANPNTIRADNTVLVGGYGDGREDDGIIATCQTEYDTGRPDDVPWGVDAERKYAFFNITTRGSGPKPFMFVSTTSLRREVYGNDIDFIFDQDVDANSTDPRGLISHGDSGGPVLNGENKLVGVVSAFQPRAQKPAVFWNYFSSFDYKAVRGKLDEPRIFQQPSSVIAGDYFWVIGQNLNRMTFKSDAGLSMKIDAGCNAMTAEQRQMLPKTGLTAGKDYQCYKSPKRNDVYRFKAKTTGLQVGYTISVGIPGS
jgi:hypothetical protein